MNCRHPASAPISDPSDVDSFSAKSEVLLAVSTTGRVRHSKVTRPIRALVPDHADFLQSDRASSALAALDLLIATLSQPDDVSSWPERFPAMMPANDVLRAFAVLVGA